MMPKAFTNLISVSNECILACKRLIDAASSCEEECSTESGCSQGAERFISESENSIRTCEACIKVCDEMIVQFRHEGHIEHMQILSDCIKTLGEYVRLSKISIDNCSINKGCQEACRLARLACEKVVQVVDACIESCEKHEVFYKHTKK